MAKLIMLSTVLVFMTQARLCHNYRKASINFLNDGGFTQYVRDIYNLAKQGIQIPLM
jgi:hypothetical protein